MSSESSISILHWSTALRCVHSAYVREIGKQLGRIRIAGPKLQDFLINRNGFNKKAFVLVLPGNCFIFAYSLLGLPGISAAYPQEKGDDWYF